MGVEFERLAPYLKDPLVLIGFFLLLAFSLSRYLVKKQVIPPLPKVYGYRILRLILLYGFIIGLLIIIFGFALKRQELLNQRRAADGIESMLREALEHAPWLPDEKKGEIASQIKEAYLSGALTDEQVRVRLEEINFYLAPARETPAASGMTPARPGPAAEAAAVNRDAPPNPVRPDTPPAKTTRPDVAAPRDASQPAAVPSKEIFKPSAEAVGQKLVYLPPPPPTRIIVPSSPRARDFKCVVELTMPEPKAKVRGDAFVRGTADIPAGTYLWVLARKKGFEGWWPQGGGAAEVDALGWWNVFARFGKVGQTGTFEVSAIAVDSTVNESLKRWVKDKPRTYFVPIHFYDKDLICSSEKVEVEKVEE